MNACSPADSFQPPPLSDKFAQSTIIPVMWRLVIMWNIKHYQPIHGNSNSLHWSAQYLFITTFGNGDITGVLGAWVQSRSFGPEATVKPLYSSLRIKSNNAGLFWKCNWRETTANSVKWMEELCGVEFTFSNRLAADYSCIRFHY